MTFWRVNSQRPGQMNLSGADALVGWAVGHGKKVRGHNLLWHGQTPDWYKAIGDRAYGGGGDDARRLGLERPFLHAWRLGFTHPVTHDRVELEDPLPGDLERALDRLRGSAD